MQIALKHFCICFFKIQYVTILRFIYIFTECWLCLTSHRQRGHLETAPPFTVPCDGREAR